MSETFENLPKPNTDQRRLFLKAGCPFCTQLAVFIASAGIQSKVKPIFDCPPVRKYVSNVNGGKCTFPALEIEEGSVVMLETQDIIRFLCEDHNINQEELWVSHLDAVSPYIHGGNASYAEAIVTARKAAGNLSIHDVLVALHVIGAYAVIMFLTVHLTHVFRHQVMLKDKLLNRMLKGDDDVSAE